MKKTIIGIVIILLAFIGSLFLVVSISGQTKPKQAVIKKAQNRIRAYDNYIAQQKVLIEALDAYSKELEKEIVDLDSKIEFKRTYIQSLKEKEEERKRHKLQMFRLFFGIW